MAGTLKERYTNKKLTELRQRVNKADAQLLREERTARLILEAMDEEDLNKVSQIIDKLRQIKRPELPVLKKAIEQAETELNKYTAGGPIVKAWTKLKGKVGIDNPIVKITTFASALEKGFSLIPQILKNNNVDLQALAKDPNALKQSLVVYLAEKTGQNKKKAGEKTDAEMAKSPFTGKQVEGQLREEDVKIEGKLKIIVDQLRKALSPSGVFGAFKKVPYADSAALAQELVRAPLQVFASVAKIVNQGTKAAEVAPDMKDVVQGKGDVETKGTGSSEPSQPTVASAGTSPTKDATVSMGSTPSGQKPAEPRGGGAQSRGVDVQKVVTRIKPAVEDLGVKDVSKLVAALEDLGVLKNPE